jgi:deoxyribodipyrimidine photo-lyase
MLRVVWFKRDLRVVDHAPLVHAAAAGAPVLPLWIAEPSLLGTADAAAQHLGFTHECLEALDDALSALGAPLHTPTGEACAVFEALRRRCGAFELLSHEETGHAASYARDRAVARWARGAGIVWRQWPNNGVVRGLSDRDRWSTIWMARMSPTPLAAPARLTPPPREAVEVLEAPMTLEAHAPSEAARVLAARTLAAPATGLPDRRSDPPQPGVQGRRRIVLPRPTDLGLIEPDKPARQRGGRGAALACLDRFLGEPLVRYRAGMSSPLSAPDDCSRLSAHLAFGTVSIRELAHATWAARRTETDPARRAGLKSFESRLHWHCHFIQKLESEPAIELRNPHRGFDGLRNEGEPTDAERALFAAWCEGRTGWPIVDACMRMLRHTGWLNFRMRAMLASVAAYPLWLHWRETGLFLARQFLDYEPGIHWPQLHMQSGVTGINATRVYSPARQQHDQDPDGRFVRRWLPELGTGDYPPPVVDWADASRIARDRIWAVRRDPASQRIARTVWTRHGSRHPAREPAGRRSTAARPAGDASRQLSLGFEDD